VDLSAIAKGHGVDRVAEVLDRADCTDYLVDIGGEVRSRGMSPRQTPWRVGIEVPDPQLIGSVQRVVNLPGMAVATSGDYRNYLDFDGERFSHSIDPRTGYPVQHLLASVSVVHESAMWADGWATALNVLGPEAGFELAATENLAAYFLIRRADGFEERYTPSMQNYLEAP
jgi:thiamine biosynthesis lipoprotein